MITLSDAQKQMFDKLLTEKVPSAQHENWRYHARKDWDSFNRAVSKLRHELPFLPEQAPPTEDGLYRDPETGKLYRIKKQGWDRIVSVYEHTDRDVLRMTEAGEVVKKGKWKKMTVFHSRLFLPKMRATWKLSPEEIVKYRYGVCMLPTGPYGSPCMRGLEDARSVYHNYGPVCAERMGLPWGDLPA